MPNEAENTALTKVDEALNKELMSTETADSMNEMMFSDSGFNQVMRMADVMSKGVSTIPKHLQGNASDCAAIIIQSRVWGMIPQVVAQKTHLVNGTLGYEAQLIHAVILRSGVFQDRPHFVDVGDWDKIQGKQTKYGDANEQGLGIKVIATLIDGSTCEHTCFISTCQVRNSPNWKSKPKVQCSYQAIKEFARLHTPDVILGVYTNDELDPRNKNSIEITEITNADSRTDALADKLCGEETEVIKPEVTVEPPTQAPPKPTAKKPTKSKLLKAIESTKIPVDTVNEYLVSLSVITTEQSYEDAPADWKAHIADNPAGFKKAVNEWLNPPE